MNKKAKRDGIQLLFEDARNDVVKQLNQVQSFISQKVGAVIVNPVDTAATPKLVESATRAGIPLVFVYRKTDNPKMPAAVVTVTSNDRKPGNLQTQYLADKLGGAGQEAILLGELSNNFTQVRTAGFKEILGKYPDINIVEEQTGLCVRDKGLDLTINWLLAYKELQRHSVHQRRNGHRRRHGAQAGRQDGCAGRRRGRLSRYPGRHQARIEGRLRVPGC